MNEELLEEGIVLKSGGGIAEIALKENAACEECSAKLFCGPQNNKLKTLTVSDPFGTHPGDEVKISVKGKEVLKVSVLLYGMPLVLILAGILIGMNLFEGYKYSELYAFIIGLLFTGFYFIFFFFKISKNIKTTAPSKIISFRKYK